MNFGWVYPEDSGEYVCRATNLYGQDETVAIIKTSGKPGIIYDSQLPKGMKSIEKIRQMEASWQMQVDFIVYDTKKYFLINCVTLIERQKLKKKKKNDENHHNLLVNQNLSLFAKAIGLDSVVELPDSRDHESCG